MVDNLPDEEARAFARDMEQEFLSRAREGYAVDVPVKEERVTTLEEKREDAIIRILEDRFSTHKVTEEEQTMMDGVRLSALTFATSLVELGCHKYEAFGDVVEDIDRCVQKMNASIARRES